MMLASTRMGETKQPRRFYELDSLRGLAAGIVVLNHFHYLLPVGLHDAISTGPLRILVNGHEAVVLFFILSGFVLTLPYARGSSPGYRDFLLKRVCRIYLPYLAALALSLAADYWSPHLSGQLSPMAGSNKWIDQTWSQPITFGPVLQHILFLGNYPSAQFNTAFWSLIYEMRISLVFPFIAMGVLRAQLSRCLAGVFVLWAASLLLNHFGPHMLHGNTDRVGDVASTLFYAIFFVMGSLLAKHLPAVDTWFVSLGRAKVALLGLGSIMLYGYSVPLMRVRHAPGGLADLCTGMGTLGLIVLAVNCGPVQRFLTTHAIHHLGKISYSLYLMHGTILFLLIHTLFGRVALVALFVLYLGITLVATEVFHRLVEVPTMRLGRRLTASPAAKERAARERVLT